MSSHENQTQISALFTSFYHGSDSRPRPGSGLFVASSGAMGEGVHSVSIEICEETALSRGGGDSFYAWLARRHPSRTTMELPFFLEPGYVDETRSGSIENRPADVFQRSDFVGD